MAFPIIILSATARVGSVAARALISSARFTARSLAPTARATGRGVTTGGRVVGRGVKRANRARRVVSHAFFDLRFGARLIDENERRRAEFRRLTHTRDPRRQAEDEMNRQINERDLPRAEIDMSDALSRAAAIIRDGPDDEQFVARTVAEQLERAARQRARRDIELDLAA